MGALCVLKSHNPTVQLPHLLAFNMEKMVEGEGQPATSSREEFK